MNITGNIYYDYCYSNDVFVVISEFALEKEWAVIITKDEVLVFNLPQCHRNHWIRHQNHTTYTIEKKYAMATVLLQNNNVKLEKGSTV